MQLRAGNFYVDRIIPVQVVMEWYRVAVMECHRSAQRWVGSSGGLVRVDTLLSTHHPTRNSHNPHCLEVYLDNKALVSCIQKWRHSGSSKTLAPDSYDLLQAAMQIAKKHNSTIIPHHVKSHQDLKIAYEKLSWESKLNCDMDSLENQARTYTRCKSDATKKYILPPGHRANFFVLGQWITGHVSMAI